jgi:hypothetical protein
VDRVHSAWTGRHARVHVGPGSGTDKRHGGVDEGLTTARAMVERWRDGSKEQQRLEFGTREKEGARKLGKEGRRRGGGWGSSRIYIGDRGCTGEAVMSGNKQC